MARWRSLSIYEFITLASLFLMPNIYRVQHMWANIKLLTMSRQRRRRRRWLQHRHRPPWPSHHHRSDPNRQRQDLSKICIYNSGHIAAAKRGHVLGGRRRRRRIDWTLEHVGDLSLWKAPQVMIIMRSMIGLADGAATIHRRSWRPKDDEWCSIGWHSEQAIEPSAPALSPSAPSASLKCANVWFAICDQPTATKP